jgi:hypothetical protein
VLLPAERLEDGDQLVVGVVREVDGAREAALDAGFDSTRAAISRG